MWHPPQLTQHRYVHILYLYGFILMREACAMARFCDSNQQRGVTLVELIVVLVILAVLAALLVPSLTGYIDKAVEKRIMLQARSLMTAAQATIYEANAKGE